MRTNYPFDVMMRDLISMGEAAARHPFFKDVMESMKKDEDCKCDEGDCKCNDDVKINSNIVGVLHAHSVSQDDKYVIYTEVPGVVEDKITVEYKDGLVVITADYNSDTPLIRKGLWRTAFKYKDVDVDKISAKFENGLLTVSVPKKAEAQPIKIQIN